MSLRGTKTTDQWELINTIKKNKYFINNPKLQGGLLSVYLLYGTAVAMTLLFVLIQKITKKLSVSDLMNTNKKQLNW